MDLRGTSQAAFRWLPTKSSQSIWHRFEFVYTPNHGSWLNMAEIELNVLIGQRLSRCIDNIS